MTEARQAGVATVAGIDVDVVAAAVRGCPSVADLSGGLLGSVGTYLPGRRVPGVVVRDGASGRPPSIELHVAARYGPSMSEVDAQVRQAVTAIAPGSPVDIIIEDVIEDVPDPDPVRADPLTEPARIESGAPAFIAGPADVEVMPVEFTPVDVSPVAAAPDVAPVDLAPAEPAPVHPVSADPPPAVVIVVPPAVPPVVPPHTR